MKLPTIPCLLLLLIVGGVSTADQQLLQTAETVLAYQRSSGGWPKNYDREEKLSDSKRSEIIRSRGKNDATIDNGATWKEIRLLARANQTAPSTRYASAAIRGVNYLLEAQYENGGWPQTFPEPTGYHAHITFNDGAMIGVLQLLNDIAAGDDDYPFIPDAARKRCKTAVARGVECILKCQIVVDGKPTAWCAQHDAGTLEPAPARSYELRSISGGESVGIVRFLMQIETPNTATINAIESAVAWFEASKITGYKLERKKAPDTQKGYDTVLVRDADATPIWARFYDIETNTPFFCSRDGVPKRTIAEISYERRNGYSWYSSSPDSLLRKYYPAWKQRIEQQQP